MQVLAEKTGVVEVDDAMTPEEIDNLGRLQSVGWVKTPAYGATELGVHRRWGGMDVAGGRTWSDVKGFKRDLHQAIGIVMFVIIFLLALPFFPLTIVAIEALPHRVARRVTAFILGGLVLALLVSCIWMGSLGERGLLSSAEGLMVLFFSQILAVVIGRVIASRRHAAHEARLNARRDRT